MATTIGSIIEGKYEILTEIGRGGMSCVYLARDTRLNKQWAVKEVKKRATDSNGDVYVQSLITEANMMMNFNHPAFPRIVDIIEKDDVIYIIMDYIEGESLDKVLRAQGPQPYERVVDWGIQLAEALRYLHNQNPPIIYRDLKPANIMYQDVPGVEHGVLKIIDFGTAREYKGSKSSDTVVMLTPGYASPEQKNRTRETDARSDIYCLGRTMHHMLTGQDPTQQNYEYKPIRQWDPSLPEGLEQLIEQCIAMDPDDRFQNCEELIYWLQDEHFREWEKDYRKKQRGKLTRFLVAAIACLVFAAVAVGSRVTGNVVKDNNYEQAVNAVGDQRESECVRAIKEIDGNRLDAYFALLDVYRDRGTFDQKESLQISGLLNAFYKADKTDPEYLELCYDIGYMYFNFYTENGNGGFAQRAAHANEYFSIINAALKEKPDLDLPARMKPWESYYHLSEMFKANTGLSVAVKHDSKDLQKILEEVSICIDSMDSDEDYNENDADSIRLSQARYFASQINALRNEFAAANVPLDEVLSVMSEIKDSENSVTLQQLDDQKSDAISECDAFIQNIRSAYDNS